MQLRPPWRGAAVRIIERPASEDEPWMAGPILDLPTVEAMVPALRRAVEEYNLDLPGMEDFAARAGTPGVNDVAATKRRDRDLLWNAVQYFTALSKMLDSDAQ